MTRPELTLTIRDAMRREQLTYAELADELGRPRVWAAAALLGQHPFSPSEAQTLAERLSLPDGAAALLAEVPERGGLDAAVPTDPTMYRLYEIVQVYGPAIKALIHEEFGDGIMSAIAFNMELERVADPDGDRVRITLDGKFLPYAW